MSSRWVIAKDDMQLILGEFFRLARICLPTYDVFVTLLQKIVTNVVLWRK